MLGGHISLAPITPGMIETRIQILLSQSYINKFNSHKTTLIQWLAPEATDLLLLSHYKIANLVSICQLSLFFMSGSLRCTLPIVKSPPFWVQFYEFWQMYTVMYVPQSRWRIFLLPPNFLVSLYSEFYPFTPAPGNHCSYYYSFVFLYFAIS